MRLASLLIGSLVSLSTGLLLCGCAQALDGNAPLVLDRTIALPSVAGRIDHMAIDPSGRRLIVAELGNNAVDVVDLATGALVHRIAGLREPQGLAFDRSGHLIVIAERADGAARLFDANTFVEVASIPLGADADNVRIDPRNGHAIVGYGGGALAVLDLDAHAVLSRIPLPAHPEGFQLDPTTGQVFVNLPDAHTIGVVDFDHGVLRASWRTPSLFNYPMALDPSETRLATVFRLPARLVLFNRADGAVIASVSTCGDSNDLFFDAPRRRIYVACGAGSVDVFDTSGSTPRQVANIRTAPGARTALFSPTLDRLFVAARAQSGRTDAEILVFRPGP